MEKLQSKQGSERTENIFGKGKKKTEHRGKIYDQMRSNKGGIWEFLTFPNTSKYPRKYEEKMRKKPVIR